MSTQSVDQQQVSMSCQASPGSCCGGTTGVGSGTYGALSNGTVVRIEGLTTARGSVFNGNVGLVKGVDSVAGRYVVEDVTSRVSSKFKFDNVFPQVVAGIDWPVKPEGRGTAYSFPEFISGAHHLHSLKDEVLEAISLGLNLITGVVRSGDQRLMVRQVAKEGKFGAKHFSVLVFRNGAAVLQFYERSESAKVATADNGFKAKAFIPDEPEESWYIAKTARTETQNLVPLRDVRVYNEDHVEEDNPLLKIVTDTSLGLPETTGVTTDEDELSRDRFQDVHVCDSEPLIVVEGDVPRREGADGLSAKVVSMEDSVKFAAVDGLTSCVNDLIHVDDVPHNDDFATKANTYLKMMELHDDHIGVSRLHKHFEFDDDEVQLSVKKGTEVHVTVVKINKLSERAVPTSWRFVHGLWKPICFTAKGEASEDEWKEVVLRSESWKKLDKEIFEKILVENDAQCVFGLSVNYLRVLIKGGNHIVETTNEVEKIQYFTSRTKWSGNLIVTHVYPDLFGKARTGVEAAVDEGDFRDGPPSTGLGTSRPPSEACDLIGSGKGAKRNGCDFSCESTFRCYCYKEDDGRHGQEITTGHAAGHSTWSIMAHEHDVKKAKQRFGNDSGHPFWRAKTREPDVEKTKQSFGKSNDTVGCVSHVKKLLASALFGAEKPLGADAV